MNTRGESPEFIHETVTYLTELEKYYLPAKSVDHEVRDQTLTALEGPTGIGKSSITEKVFELAPEIRPVGSTLTRPLRPNDPDGFNHVTYAEFRQLADKGAFLNFNMLGMNGYGTLPSGLPAKHNIGPILAKSTERLLTSGLKQFSIGFIVTDGQSYENELLASRISFSDFKPRAREGHESIDFARRNISASWLHFIENLRDDTGEGLTKAAQKVIDITLGNSSSFMTELRALHYLDEMDDALYRVEKILA